MWWKKNTKTNKERAEIRKRFLTNPNIGYSLYKYLTEEYADLYPEETENYDPENYQHEDKETILKKLRETNKSPVEIFLNMLEDKNCRDAEPPDNIMEPRFNLIGHYKPNSNRNNEKYKYILVSEFRREFSKWFKQEHGGRNISKLSEITSKEMGILGWTEAKKKIGDKSYLVFSHEEEKVKDKNDNADDAGEYSEPEDLDAY
jgi:hypothetical protein